MKIISHRGNLHGPDKVNENTISAIENCLSLGFDVEVDIWYEDKKFYLGHDQPQYELNLSLFQNDKIWFHLKNLDTIERINDYSPKNFFWHEEDQCTITSSGFFWLYPTNYIENNRAIFVLPEIDKDELKYSKYLCYGICTDFAISYKNKV